MKLVIEDTAEQVADYVAEYVAQRIIEFAPSADKPFVLGVSTGSTVLPVFAKLVELYRRGAVSFEHVATFNIDEYSALPRDNPHSKHSVIWNGLLKHVDIRRENVHVLDGNARDAAAECARYERVIRDYGGIELAFFGTGPDGTVGRNEPGSSLQAGTRTKTLAHCTMVHINTLQWGASGGEQSGSLVDLVAGVRRALVPKMSLTMGMSTLRGARELVALFTGVTKAQALFHAIERPVSHMCPVSILQMHPRACFVADQAACSELQHRTYKYFEGLTRTHASLYEDEDEGDTTGDDDDSAALPRLQRGLSAAASGAGSTSTPGTSITCSSSGDHRGGAPRSSKDRSSKDSDVARRRRLKRVLSSGDKLAQTRSNRRRTASMDSTTSQSSIHGEPQPQPQP